MASKPAKTPQKPTQARQPGRSKGRVENPRPPNDRGQGQKGYKPEPADRRLVTAAAGMGLRKEAIALLVINPRTSQPISKSTLENHFELELRTGKAQAHYNIGKSLYDQAMGVPTKNAEGQVTGYALPPSASAAIFFAKTQMGWRERFTIDLTDLEAIVAALGGNLDALRAARAAVPAEEG